MLIFKFTPYEVAIIVVAWLVLVVGVPVALRFAVGRWRRASSRSATRPSVNTPPNRAATSASKSLKRPL